MSIKMQNHLRYRFMPMIILSYLFINLYLIMIGSSWCQSEGCEVSKNLLHIEQTELYGLAIVSFGILLITGLNILKTDSYQLKEFYKFSIFTIMICETILLSYLYFKTGTLCISCFIFYILVIINFLLLNIKSKNLFVIPFVIIAIGLLDLDVSITSNESISSKYTLLQSENCEHCKKVKEYLKDNSIVYQKENYMKYSGLFSSLNITKIPVMIVQENDNNLLLLNGVSEIIKYLDSNTNKKVLSKITKTRKKNNNFILIDEKEGCEIDFLKKELETCK